MADTKMAGISRTIDEVNPELLSLLLAKKITIEVYTVPNMKINMRPKLKVVQINKNFKIITFERRRKVSVFSNNIATATPPQSTPLTKIASVEMTRIGSTKSAKRMPHVKKLYNIADIMINHTPTPCQKINTFLWQDPRGGSATRLV